MLQFWMAIETVNNNKKKLHIVSLSFSPYFPFSFSFFFFPPNKWTFFFPGIVLLQHRNPILDLFILCSILWEIWYLKIVFLNCFCFLLLFFCLTAHLISWLYFHYNQNDWKKQLNICLFKINLIIQRKFFATRRKTDCMDIICFILLIAIICYFLLLSTFLVGNAHKYFLTRIHNAHNANVSLLIQRYFGILQDLCA